MPMQRKGRKPVPRQAKGTIGDDYWGIERDARKALEHEMSLNKMKYRTGRPPKTSQRPKEEWELEEDGLDGLDFVDAE